MNTIVNMFPSKDKEDNDTLVRYSVERKPVVKEIVKPSSSLKLQCCKPLRLKHCVNIFMKIKFLLSFFVSWFFS